MALRVIQIMFITTVFINYCHTQFQVDTAIIKAINTQIWDQFTEAYKQNDIDLFISIHSPSVARITPWGIRIGDEYFDQMRQNFSSKQAGDRSISFRFEHRVHRDSLAYEVGFYRLVYHHKNKPDEYHYGRFNVMLRRLDGQWKISQDWDDSEISGIKVTAADYLSAPN